MGHQLKIDIVLLVSCTAEHACQWRQMRAHNPMGSPTSLLAGRRAAGADVPPQWRGYDA